jgi:hypothetical protein
MATNRQYRQEIAEVSLSNFGSAIHETFFGLAPEDFGAVAHMQWAMSGNGQVRSELSFYPHSPTTELWTQGLTFTATSAAAGDLLAQYATTDELVKPLLPVCRVRTRFEALTAGQVDFVNTVVRLLVET